MTDSNYTIEVKGAAGASQAAKLDTSNIQKSINQVAADLKKLDTSNFQKSLKDLTQGIGKSATAASNFVANMQKIEAQISASLKAGFSPGKAINSNQSTPTKADTKKSESGLESKNTEKFVQNISSLTDAIDKLTSGIKDNFKPKEKPEEKPEVKKDNLVNDVKKLLAAVGVGSIVKQMAENEFVNPARNAGMLINSNVVSNPTQVGSQLLASYGQREASNTGSILGIAGGIVGGIAGSFLPGLGTLYGAGLGYGGGKLLGDTIGQSTMAPETAIKQRALQLDYYSNLSRQIPSYGAAANSQYPYAYGETGQTGFMSNYAVKDPYFESRAVLSKSYSRFAGGSLSDTTTSGILGSLTAQGASSPQDVSITGNLLGQIARYTGKSSIDIEKVYKSVEKSGLSPNEGLQKALSLLQSGQTIKETTDIIRRDSQRTEAYSAGQTNYLSSSPYSQFRAQLMGRVTGVNQEKFFHGTDAEKAHEIAKAHKIFVGAEIASRKGIITQDSHFAEMLENGQGIWPGMADNNRSVARAKAGGNFITPGVVQAAVIQDAQKTTDNATKGRDANQLIKEALSSISSSTKAMDGLGGAAGVLVHAFESAAAALFNYAGANSPLAGLWLPTPKVFASPQARKN